MAKGLIMKQTPLTSIMVALGLLLLLWNTPGFCQDTLPALPDTLVAQSVDVQRDEGGTPTIERPQKQGQIIRTAPDPAHPFIPQGEKVRDGGRMLEAGWDALGLGNYEQALTFFDQALELFPPGNQSNEASLGRAYALKELERNDDAASALEDLLQTGYRPDEVRAALSQVLVQPEQMEQVQAVPEQPDDDEAPPLTMAWNCYETGDIACAEDLFRHVLQNNPADESALEGLVLLLESQGRIDEAIALTEASPDQMSLTVLTRLYLLKADKSFVDRNYSRTLDWLDKHADIAPQDSQTMAIRSWALYHLQKYDQALDIFSKQLLLFPDNEKALLGKIYSLQASGRHQEALSVLESWEEELSAELQGVLGSLYCTIGNDEYSAGNVDQALVYLEQCVERNPDAREVEVLGWNLLETGDSKAA
ncbi:MAG: tetratricopeptide repeat protein, partial [Desulfonatronovibrio sp.]